MFCPTETLKECYVELAHWCCEKCDENDLIGNIGVLFSERFTRKIGEARYYCEYELRPAYGLIRLSTPLFEIATDKQRKSVVVHESCHLIANHCAFKHAISIKPHGIEWQQLMLVCGEVPRATFPVHPGLLTKPSFGIKIMMKCDCPGGSLIGPQQFYRLVEESRAYYCKICGVELIP